VGHKVEGDLTLAMYWFEESTRRNMAIGCKIGVFVRKHRGGKLHAEAAYVDSWIWGGGHCVNSYDSTLSIIYLCEAGRHFVNREEGIMAQSIADSLLSLGKSYARKCALEIEKILRTKRN